MGLLEGYGGDFCVVGEHRGIAAFGAVAGAVPDAGVFAAAGREPATGVIEGEFLNLALVAAHVEFDVGFGNPQVNTWVLIARN